MTIHHLTFPIQSSPEVVQSCRCPSNRRSTSDPIYAELGDKGLDIHWDGVIPGQVVKDEHGLKVVFSPDHRQFIRLGGKTFHLASFHFHHPSEHWIDGEQHTVELQVVHQNINDGSLAVVGIFIEVGETSGKCPELIHQLRSFLGHPPSSRSRGVRS